MAILSKIQCERCGKVASVMHSPSARKPKVCSPCKAKELEEARENHLSAMGDLPLEERLRRIEAWIYDYRPQYVPPPMF